MSIRDDEVCKKLFFKISELSSTTFWSMAQCILYLFRNHNSGNSQGTRKKIRRIVSNYKSQIIEVPNEDRCLYSNGDFEVVFGKVIHIH